MDAASPSADPAAADSFKERAEQRIAMLREAAELALRMARGLVQKVESGPAAGAPDPALQFARVTKATRQTLALEARFDAELDRRDRKLRLIGAWRAALTKFPPSSNPPDGVPRILERLIDSEADPDEIAELLREIGEANEPSEPGHRGVSDETIAMIKYRILGLKPALPDPPGTMRPRTQPPAPPAPPGPGAADPARPPAGPDPPSGR
jgi:hypothetical protein